MKAKEIYMYVFAALFVIGFFIIAVVFRNTAESSFVTGVMETIKNGVILIIGYFFGSSKSSADKTELLNK